MAVITKRRVRKADAEAIARAEWRGDALLVEFETGERFLLPIATLRERAADLVRKGLRVADRWHLVIPTRRGAPAEIPGDFVRYHCDARYRLEMDREAAKDRIVVGRALATARARGGLTQAALAKRSRVSRVTIARIETGATDTSFATLQRLAHALSMTLPQLLQAGSRSPPPARQTRITRLRGRR